MRSTPSDPRIYLLRAAASPHAVVFVKHTSKYWSVHRWDLAAMHVEEGGVLHGSLYPRRSDVSPDGRYLLYFAMSGSSDEAWPRTFTALSRAPWLRALVAWREIGTYSNGMHFAGQARGAPEIAFPSFLHQIAAPIERCPWNIGQNTPADLPAERRSGWVKVDDSMSPKPTSGRDPRRCVVLSKPRPGWREELRLVVTSDLASGRPVIEGQQNLYSRVTASGETVELPAYCWLDWLDGDHLYGATCDGRLVVCALRAGEMIETWSHRFRPRPTRQPAPPSARSW